MVLVDVMRGGPSTGTPTKGGQQDVMQARWGTHGDHASICYAPSSAQECYEIAIHAFNNAERFRQPVLILSDEVIAHMREKVLVPERKYRDRQQKASRGCAGEVRSVSAGPERRSALYGVLR